MGGVPHSDQFQNKQNNSSNKLPAIFFWTGQYIEYRNFDSNLTFQQIVSKVFVKSEFEKTADFYQRTAREREKYLNSYLGNQMVEMKYNADKETFSVSINKSLHFKIKIPINSAEYFKSSVKYFSVGFDQSYNIVEITANYSYDNYKAFDFKNSWFHDLQKAKAEKPEQIKQKLKQFDQKLLDQNRAKNALVQNLGGMIDLGVAEAMGSKSLQDEVNAMVEKTLKKALKRGLR